jgi:hypothetical protein
MPDDVPAPAPGEELRPGENPVGFSRAGTRAGRGNPNWDTGNGTGTGRTPLRRRIERFLDAVDEKYGVVNEDRIVQVHVEKAKRGDLPSTVWLMEHVYGKVADRVLTEHTVSVVPWEAKSEAEAVLDDFDLRERRRLVEQEADLAEYDGDGRGVAMGAGWGVDQPPAPVPEQVAPGTDESGADPGAGGDGASGAGRPGPGGDPAP